MMITFFFHFIDFFLNEMLNLTVFYLEVNAMGTKHTRTFKLVTCCFTWDLLDVLVVAYVHTHADTHTHVNREKGWLLSSLSGALFSVSFSSFTSEK